ncbi:MAG: UDP-N-acetylmuramate dehydrogenase [Pseudomonadota bacterium]
MMEFQDITGHIDFDADIAPYTWFRVGGKADILFRPSDPDDLSNFLTQLPSNMPVHILGMGSNIIIRDGGIRGAVIRLGRGFGKIERQGETEVRVGAAVPDINLAKFLAKEGLMGGAFLRGIPGSIGGAIFMNAGSYGTEIKDIFVSAEAVSRAGEKLHFSYDDMGFKYRYTVPRDLIYTHATLKFREGSTEEILQEMEAITSKRNDTQPVKSRTGGSSFKNPEGYKAWELIDQAGCRGLKIGGAEMSELHCNFMLNSDNASAYDIELLGETVRERVFAATGILLEWEIKRIGDFAAKIVKPFHA